jgi:hypothetical protein
MTIRLKELVYMIKSFNFEEFGLKALKATDSRVVRGLMETTFSNMVTVVNITTEAITLEADLDEVKMELLIRAIDEQFGNFLRTGDVESTARVFATMALGVSAVIKTKKQEVEKPLTLECDDGFTIDINNDGSGAIVISAKLADMPAMTDASDKVKLLNKVFSGNKYYFSLNKKATKLKMLCEEREGDWKLFFGVINSCFTKENPEEYLEIMAKIEMVSYSQK